MSYEEEEAHAPSMRPAWWGPAARRLGDRHHGRALVAALAERGLRLQCVTTSEATAKPAARAAGLMIESFDALDRLDIAIDGADEVAPAAGW